MKLIPYVLQWNALDFLRAKLVGANSLPGETTILVSSGIVYDGIFQVLFDQDTLIQWLFPPRKVFLKTRCSVNNGSIKDAWLYRLYLDTIQSKFDRKKKTIEILNKRKWTLYALQLLTL